MLPCPVSGEGVSRLWFYVRGGGATATPLVWSGWVNNCRYTAVQPQGFRPGPFAAWHAEAIPELRAFVPAVRNKSIAQLQERRRCIQQDHLAQAARVLRNLCGKQLLSPEGRAHHAVTVAVVPDWERLVQRARHDAMAEFWHVCHAAFMLNVHMVVVRPPAAGSPNGSLIEINGDPTVPPSNTIYRPLVGIGIPMRCIVLHA